MDIRPYITRFIRLNHRYKPYSKICKNVLDGGKPYSLNAQTGYMESEYLPITIRNSVQAYSSNKDTAIALYKDFVRFLNESGLSFPTVEFPPIPVANTFERLMFIAKYLQDEIHRISDLTDLLWVSPRTVEEDIRRLRGLEDPIQVCGKKFFITEVDREGGSLHFSSTAHPVFLSENLTQILIMLKGLKEMSENPLYRPYAIQSGREIWGQLSIYARKRIYFVLRELMPEELSWYDKLSEECDDVLFHSEEACSRIHNEGPGVLMDCIKNGKSFCVEYTEENEIQLYRDCVMEKGSYLADPASVIVSHSTGRKKLLFSNVVRSAYTVEELLAF